MSPSSKTTKPDVVNLSGAGYEAWAGVNPWWTFIGGSLPGVGSYAANVGTGQNLFVGATDLALTHKGIDLSFVRAYNSQSLHDVSDDDGSDWPGQFGNGWTNSFDAHLATNSGNVDGNGISVFDGNGTRYDYLPDGKGHWIAPPGVHAALTFDGVTGYYLTRTDGTVYHFYEPGSFAGCPGGEYAAYCGLTGRLTEILGRNNNDTLTFTYSWIGGNASTAADLSEITVAAESGLTVSLTFASFSGNRLLSSLTWPNGTTVTYWYDQRGDLSEVDEPPGSTSATNCESGSACLPQQYTYIGGHLLNTVSSPRYVINQNDGAYTQFSYYSWNGFEEADNVGNVNPEISDGFSTTPIQGGTSESTKYRAARFDQGIYTGTVPAGDVAWTWHDSDLHQVTFIFGASTGAVVQTYAWTDSTNLSQTQTWDTNNDLLSQTDARGNQYNFAYNSIGNLTAAAAPPIWVNNVQVSPTYVFAYDDFNNVTAFCDAVYSNNNGMDWPVPKGKSCPTAPTQGVETFSYSYPSYEPYGELAAAYSATGYEQTFSYASSPDYGQVTTIQGTTITQVDNSQRTPVTNFSYDQNGRILCVGNGVGTGTLQYDTMGRLTAYGDADDASLSGCSKTAGIPLSKIVTSFSYLPNSEVSSVQTPSELAAGVQTAYTYDADGNLSSTTRHYGCVSGSTCTPGVTQEWHDADERLVEVSLPAAVSQASFNQPWLTRYWYDLTQGTGTVAVGSFTGLHAYGQLFKAQEALPGATGLTSWSDTKGNAYDALDRATEAISHLGAWQSAAYAYDAPGDLGLLSSRTDSVGNVASLTYDNDGNITARSYSGGPTQTPNASFSYDLDGRMISETSALFGTHSYSFNAEGKLTGETEPSGSTLTSPATYTYGLYGDGLRSTLSVSSSGLTQNNLESLAYRTDGFLNKESILDGSISGTYVWSATSGQRPQTLTDPFETAYRYAYAQSGSDGLPMSKTIPAGSYSGITYDFEGLLTGYTAYSGVAFANTYNARGELQSNTTSQLPSLCAGKVVSPTFPEGATNSANGIPVPQNVCSGSTAIDELGWDSLSGQVSGRQLWSPSGLIWIASFGYDSAGRQTSSTSSISDGKTCSTNNSEWTSGTYARTFDANDHLTSQIDTSYVFYLDNSPSCGTTQSIGLAYGWGVDNRLLSAGYTASNPAPGATAPPLSTAQSVTVHWNGNSVLFTSNPNGSVTDIKIGGFAEILPSSSTYPNLTTIDRDLSGVYSSRHNATQNWGWYPQDPNNVLPSSTGSNTNITTPWIQQLRSDGYTDSYNQFQGARSYDSSSGSWTSADQFGGSINDPMSQKSYAYLGNNSVSNSDPSGAFVNCVSCLQYNGYNPGGGNSGGTASYGFGFDLGPDINDLVDIWLLPADIDDALSNAGIGYPGLTQLRLIATVVGGYTKSNDVIAAITPGILGITPPPPGPPPPPPRFKSLCSGVDATQLSAGAGEGYQVNGNLTLTTNGPDLYLFGGWSGGGGWSLLPVSGSISGLNVKSGGPAQAIVPGFSGESSGSLVLGYYDMSNANGELGGWGLGTPGLSGGFSFSFPGLRVGKC